MFDPTLKTLTILLLVADPLVRTVFKEVLENEGYIVLASGDLGYAVDRLKEVTPDLLITRTYVQNLSGHDAAKYLRSKCPKMKVLIVGGLLDDERLLDREALQGFAVFPKAYTTEALLTEVRRVLSAARG